MANSGFASITADLMKSRKMTPTPFQISRISSIHYEIRGIFLLWIYETGTGKTEIDPKYRPKSAFVTSSG